MKNIPHFWGKRTLDGKLTATGVLNDYWPEISQNWKEEATITGYIGMLNGVLLKHYSQKPLEEFTCKADFEKLIDDIKEQGKLRPGGDPSYKEATLNKFRFLIRRILKIAAKHGVCLDVLWGTHFEETDPKALEKEEKVVEMKIPKSLQPKEEYLLEKMVFKDPLQAGELMFILLMWALGGRPNAIVDIRWYDIHLVQGTNGKYAIALLTTFYKKDESKLGGKTENMYRLIPISRRLYKFLMKRRCAVKAAFWARKEVGTLPAGIDTVDELPVCCAGDDYFRRCDLRKARNLCRDYLRKIGVKEAVFRYYERRAENSDDLNRWGEEKSVTSYILRRNFCTHLGNLCFTEEEIVYLMGHSMKDMSRNRADMNFPSNFIPMWDKLEFRPIFNPFPDWNERAFISHGEHVSVSVGNIPQQNILIEKPGTGGELIVQVTPNEAGDPIIIDIELETEDGSIIPLKGTYQVTPALSKQPKEVNVVADLLRMYKASRISRNTKPKGDCEEKKG